MVKKNSRKNNSKPRSRPRRGAISKPVRSALTRLDAAAAAHARMLIDPCNAPLVAPTYSGLGTGEYRRYRTLITVPAAVEGMYVFQPSTNSYLVGTHVAANAGTPYTMNSRRIFSRDELGIDFESRCLAACVKVRYIGAESTRQGVIGLATAPNDNGYPGQTITNGEALSRCVLLNRLGEVQHEVKFVPGTGDEAFSTGATGLVQDPQRNCGSMTVVFGAVPDQTLQIEVTAIMEIEAAVSSGLVASAIPPRSSNTLNHVIRALGPTVQWAFGHVVAPTIRAMAGGAMQTISNGLSAASTSRMLLTL